MATNSRLLLQKLMTHKSNPKEPLQIPCPAPEHGGEKVFLTFRQCHGRWLVSCPGCTKERLREVLDAQGWWGEIAADPAQTPSQGVRCEALGEGAPGYPRGKGQCRSGHQRRLRTKLSEKDIEHAQTLVEQGKPVQEIAALFNVHRTTLYRALPQEPSAPSGKAGAQAAQASRLTALKGI